MYSMSNMSNFPIFKSNDHCSQHTPDFKKKSTGIVFPTLKHVRVLIDDHIFELFMIFKNFIMGNEKIWPCISVSVYLCTYVYMRGALFMKGLHSIPCFVFESVVGCFILNY